MLSLSSILDGFEQCACSAKYTVLNNLEGKGCNSLRLQGSICAMFLVLIW